MSVLLSLLSRRIEYGVQEFHTSGGVFWEAMSDMNKHFSRLLTAEQESHWCCVGSVGLNQLVAVPVKHVIHGRVENCLFWNDRTDFVEPFS